MLKKHYLIMFFLLVNYVFAQQKDTIIKSISPNQVLDEVVIKATKRILGSKFQARNRTGSAYFISPAEMKKMGYTDINRMLKSVPGVNMYEEDGYGLRPNISLRGTKAERSAKITLMEDGILASPAPYASPAAYYFPNAGRMSAVEVLKGSSQVQFGPFTTGGAINMVSTPIPDDFSGKFNASYGTNNTAKAHVNFGDKNKNFGYLVEYLRYQSDGFKKFENGDDAKFKRNDFIAKFLLKTDKKQGVNHSVEFKYGYADENSDETYVGLTERDFYKNPYLRYAGSRVDNMKSDHQQFVFTYLLKFSRKFKITSNAYYNVFNRNWYKLSNVKSGVRGAEKRSVLQILSDPETNSEYYDILTGNTDSKIYYTDYNRLKDNPGLFVKANNRTYYSKGLQTKAEFKLILGDFILDNELGLRYHMDAERRFQWEDIYSIKNKKMELLWAEIHGTNANKIVSAKALAAHALSKIKYNNLTATLGLRFEDIRLLEKDYGKNDPRTTGFERIETPNNTSVLIPSLGLHYKFNREISVFSGIHKGFSPPSVSKKIQYRDRNGNLIVLSEDVKPEKSTNFEVGARYSSKKLKVELIGFYNDFSNMLGSDLAAAGGTGNLLQFNVGEATVKGAEFMVSYQPFSESSKIKVPMQLSYTYTDSEMKNSFESSIWGRVLKGDELPYINKHIFNLSIGGEYGRYQLNFGIRHNADVRTEPGQGRIANRLKVPSNTIIDASAKAKINNYFTLSVKAINLTDKKYLVSRHPSGLRPGHPLGVFGGIEVKF